MGNGKGKGIVESYKSSTTRKKMNWAGHELLSFKHIIAWKILPEVTHDSRDRKSDLKNCVWSFPKIENRQLILAEYIKTAFRSKRLHRKHYLLRWRKSLLITHSVTQAPSSLMRTENSFFSELNRRCKFRSEKFTYLYSTFDFAAQ